MPAGADHREPAAAHVAAAADLLLDAGARGFLEYDLEGGLGFALLVDEGLQRKRALAGVGCGDEGFADGHGRRGARQGQSQPGRAGRFNRKGGGCGQPMNAGRSGISII